LVSIITHSGGIIHIDGGSYTNIGLNSQPLIVLSGDPNDSSGLLNITNTNFNGVESRGNFAAVIGTVVTQVLNYKFCNVVFFVKGWRILLSNVNISNSNSSDAVNNQGMISLSTTSSAVVVLSNVLFDGIHLSLTANGAFSVNGQMQSLSIVGSTFRGIRTGNAGGGLYLNVSSYSTAYYIDTYIANSV
jgi:hypothetical protein